MTEEELEKPFVQELIEHGMLVEMTDTSKQLIVDHTCQLQILNNHLRDLCDILAKPLVADKLKKVVFFRVLRWTAYNLLREDKLSFFDRLSISRFNRILRYKSKKMQKELDEKLSKGKEDRATS